MKKYFKYLIMLLLFIPTIVLATSVSNVEINDDTITWDEFDGAVSYDVYIKFGDDDAVSTNVATTSVSFSDLQNDYCQYDTRECYGNINGYYTVYVEAKNDLGETIVEASDNLIVPVGTIYTILTQSIK